MEKQCLAFVGFFPYQAHPVARRLEQEGMECHWVVRWRSEAVWLQQHGVAPERVLDTSALPLASDFDAAVEQLASLERQGMPCVRDLILMDRHLRRKSYEFCVRYLAAVKVAVIDFLKARGVRFITAPNDTALQILAAYAARAEGIGAVAPAPVRLPRNRFAFITNHRCEAFLPVRAVTDDDRALAAEFLGDFVSRRTVTGYMPTSGEHRSVAALVRHSRKQLAFVARVLPSYWRDRGNEHTRWSMTDFASMFAAKQRNWLQLRLGRFPISEVGTRPFVFYALHKQPESSIDVLAAHVADQVNLIRQIARATPVTHDVFVKIHKGDINGWPASFYKTLKEIPGVKVLDPGVDTFALIQRASAVMTATGTIAYEAGLLQRPAITFANLYFCELPTVHYCACPSQLPELMRTVLEQRTGARDRSAEVVEFVAKLIASSFPGQYNNMDGVYSAEELDSLAAAYRHAYASAAAAGARRQTDGELPT